MKRTLLFLLFISLSSFLFCQSVSIDFQAGYCLPIASSYHSIDAREIEVPTPPFYYSTYRSVRSASYGQGGNVAFGFNWFSKKDIGYRSGRLALRLLAVFRMTFPSPGSHHRNRHGSSAGVSLFFLGHSFFCLLFGQVWLFYS